MILIIEEDLDVVYKIKLEYPWIIAEALVHLNCLSIFIK